MNNFDKQPLFPADGATKGKTGFSSLSMRILGSFFHSITAYYGKEVVMKPSLVVMTFVFIFAFVGTGSLNAQQTWWVDDDGDPLNGTGHQNNPFRYIAQGITAASDDDEVRVMPGTYVENPVIQNKDIFLKSNSGSSVTTIDGNQAGSVVSLDNSDSTVEGFTITNGKGASSGGGIMCSDSKVIITDNIITDNSTAPGGSGGGVYLFCSSTKLYAVINDNSISNNSADQFGGGICCVNLLLPDIEYNEITGNSAGTRGGGVYCNDSSQPHFINNEINGNNATQHGGGIYCTGSYLYADSNVINNNTANQDGGGIYCTDSELSIKNSEIDNNNASSGAGIYCSELKAIAFIRHNTIHHNIASSAGGAVYCYKSSPELYTNFLYANEAAYGGGLYFDIDSGAEVVNCCIYENTASVDGGGICCSDADNVVVVHSTMYSNSASGYGGGINSTNSTVTVTNTIMREHSPGSYYVTGGGFGISYCNFEEATGSNNNISGDPLLVNPSAGDFHIPESSPCVDSGDNSTCFSSVDFEGDPRILVSMDMGADECMYPHDSLTLDVATISVSQGGNATFTLHAGPAWGGKDYFILGSISGTSPGTPLPGGQVIPINWDFATTYLLNLTLQGFPYLQDFYGTLDGGGHSTAVFIGQNLNPSIVGIVVYFAFTTYPKFQFVSNAVSFQFVQ